MNDLEQRLRTAMTATAEPAPFGLMDGIRRRHQRHRRRFMAGSAAAVAALGLALLPTYLPRMASPTSSAASGGPVAAAGKQATAAGSKPWWLTPGVSACGPPARVRFDGKVQSVGSCAGLLGDPGLKVTLHVGQRIDVHMTEEFAGPHGNRLVPVIPLPSSSRPSVVALATATGDHATATYLALHPGQAVLASHTRFCMVGTQEITGNCPVVQITVVP